jgi:hypothetical protein
VFSQYCRLLITQHDSEGYDVLLSLPVKANARCSRCSWFLLFLQFLPCPHLTIPPYASES